MEKTTHLKIGAITAAFLLMETFAVAQAAPRARTLKPREGSSGQASGIQQRKDGAIQHSDYPRQADQRKNGAVGGIDGGSNAAAHAAARSEAPNNAKAGENPLYEQSGKSGTNPLYESKDQLKTNAGTSDSRSVESYKDPEDMTTRYRPGNNRTTRSDATAPETADDASRKHAAGVKYENRAAGKQSNGPSSKENFKQDFGQVKASKR